MSQEQKYGQCLIWKQGKQLGQEDDIQFAEQDRQELGINFFSLFISTLIKFRGRNFILGVYNTLFCCMISSIYLK